jgi:formamidopyrimidine-DNA glycosylase
MTGAFRVPDRADLPLASRPHPDPDEAWPPRFTKIHLRFEDGGELVMTNARRLGRILLRARPEEEPPISRLGFDPLLDGISAGEFRARVSRRRTSMKALLLDQSLVAGVGNWIADEVLYQARIDPRRRADELDVRELERVRRKLLAVIERAVAVDADKQSFPPSWLFHVRWGKNAEARTIHGHRVEFLQLGGRTTAWVPALQS